MDHRRTVRNLEPCGIALSISCFCGPLSSGLFSFSKPEPAGGGKMPVVGKSREKGFWLATSVQRFIAANVIIGKLPQSLGFVKDYFTYFNKKGGKL